MNECPVRVACRAHRAVMIGVACLACLGMVSVACAESKSGGGTQMGNVMRGWQVFHAKRCVECHAVWDEGGRDGPDLGRAHTGRMSGGRLAGIMWNHIPKMLGRMEQTGRPPTTLTRDEMSDLFALIFFVRQLDEQGDPQRGERILQVKGCTECHSIGSAEEGIGPDLAKWGRYANPVAWAQMMWEHAPMMEEAMNRSGISWPKLEESDLVHILAYVRGSAGGGEREYLRPGSDAAGRALFEQKGCNACHPGTGPDLARTELPTSIGALAARMWNHSPTMVSAMREHKMVRQPMTAQELADILVYVLALGNADRAGDPVIGRSIFEQKRCAECHDADEVSATGAPPLTALWGDAAPVDMAAAMWNHGGTMLQQMTEAGLSWPVFNDEEMEHLLAFLEQSKQSDSRK